MSMDWMEAAQESAYLDMYQEHRELALREFRQEQLQSYFLVNPDVARDALSFLSQARTLLDTSPSAAHALAFAATEVGIKNLLFRPLVSGLVHTEAVAPILAELVFQQRSLGSFKPLLFDLLRRFGNVDLTVFAREGSSITLWKEVTEHADIRNRIVHRCKPATPAEAMAAVEMAAEVLTRLFPAVVKELGFHIHDEYRVCGENHLPADMQALLDSVQAEQATLDSSTTSG